MNRDIEKDLIAWKNYENRLPLLVRGARQVGKTYVIEKFGRDHFERVFTINFELQPELVTCFSSLDPQKILTCLTLMTGETIKPGKTLLFLDEIQECPNAIKALRYFKEKLPALHVIGAGSLLEFTLNDANFRMPVGRIQSLYLRPLSFKEYLCAAGSKPLRDFLEQINDHSLIEESIHQKLLAMLREYLILGGMPAVLQEYFSSQDMYQCQQIQTALLNTYRHDFGKYATLSDHKYLQRLYEKVPALVAQHFKYVSVDSEMRSRDIKSALEMLRHAGLVHLVYANSASGVPLSSLINEKKFKLLFLDVGLIVRSGKFNAELLLSEDLLLVNRGAIAEQFVGQELLAYMPSFEDSNLYFWCRDKKSAMAEVDFVTAVDAKIVPIEVKSGNTGRLKSLQIFLEEKESSLGVRVSQLPLGVKGKILSLPLYMVSELPRLVLEAVNMDK